MDKKKAKKNRDKRTLGENDLKYLTFIDELKKNVRLDSPTAEISRMYREVIDILTEAFDEYEPSDLPKYKERLEYIIELSDDESALSDPLFKEDLQKAKSLLETKIKERWGFYEKLKHVGSVFARNVGGLTSIGQEIIELHDKASNIGSKFASFGGNVSRKVDDEERRRVQDLLRGNEGQYGNTLPSTQQQSGALVPTNKSIVPVKDDKLIGTNTTQNKVLNSLLVVSKDTNKDIKEIKRALKLQEQQADDQADDSALQSLEDKQEEGTSPIDVKNKKGLFAALAGLAGGSSSKQSQNENGDQENKEPGVLDTVLDVGKDVAVAAGEYWAGGKLVKGAKWGWNLLKGAKWGRNLLRGGQAAAAGTAAAGTAAAGTAAAETAAAGTAAAGTGTTLGGVAATLASSPAVLAAGGMAAGAGLAYLTVPPAMKGARSLAATIGEKRKGINYYKDVFKYELDDEGRDKAEGWALQYLYKEAKDKQELFASAFQDGSANGDGSYKIDGKPVKRDEAQKDVQAAVDIYNKYNEYLVEKKKKGGLTATATFKGSNGKVYQNPLYKQDEMPPPVPGQVEVAPVQNSSEFLSSDKSSSDSTTNQQPPSAAKDSQGVVESPTVDQNREVLSNLKKNKASLEKSFNAKIGEALKKGDANEAQRLSDERDEAVKRFHAENITPLEKQIADQNKEARRAREQSQIKDTEAVLQKRNEQDFGPIPEELKGKSAAEVRSAMIKKSSEEFEAKRQQQMQETEAVLQKRNEQDFGPIPEELKGKSAAEVRAAMTKKIGEEYKSKRQDQMQETEAVLQKRNERDFGPIPEELKGKSAAEVKSAMIKKSGEEFEAQRKQQMQETEAVLQKRNERDFGPIPEELKGKSAAEVRAAMTKKIGEEYQAKRQQQVDQTNKTLSEREQGTKTTLEHFGRMGRMTKDENERIEAKVKEDILSKPSQKGGADKEITGTTFKEKAPVVMERLMKDLNIGREDAAAIVGNLGHESAGMKPDINEGKPVVPGSKGGYGWAQWTGTRRKEFEQFAKDNKLDVSSDEANYQFLVHELRNKESKSLDALKNAEGLENKTVAFEKSYERAGIKHYDKRLQYAQKANEHYGNASADLKSKENEQVMLARNDVELQPKGQDSVQNAVSRLSRDGEASKSQPIIVSQNMSPPPPPPRESTSVSTKQVGAPSNGVAESSFILALRQNLSPVG